jgi:hypothetical protein
MSLMLAFSFLKARGRSPAGDDERTYRAGDTFEMSAGCRHAERCGPEGARYLAGRRYRENDRIVQRARSRNSTLGRLPPIWNAPVFGRKWQHLVLRLNQMVHNARRGSRAIPPLAPRMLATG